MQTFVSFFIISLPILSPLIIGFVDMKLIIVETVVQHKKLYNLNCSNKI